LVSVSNLAVFYLSHRNCVCLSICHLGGSVKNCAS